MKNRKIFVGAAAALALFINIPQVSAEDEEVIPFKTQPSENNRVVVEPEPEISTDKKKKSSIIFKAPKTKVVEPADEGIKMPRSGDDFISMEEPAEIETTTPDSKFKNTNKKTDKQKVKTEKARFLKVAVDDAYIYYIDRQTITWKRIPYSASEYMIDFWVRMIELKPDMSDVPKDLYDYINDTNSGEIEIAQEQNIQYDPADVNVLQHKKYYLEHYYVRPKTKQIQFLCELEVIGRPQNTISEREYDHKNWENLVPSSIESLLYKAVTKEAGKGGNADNGKMTGTDVIEEYLRISLR